MSHLKLVPSPNPDETKPNQTAPPKPPVSESATTAQTPTQPSGNAQKFGPRLTEKGQFNVCEGFIGVPGSGKSTCALARAIELQRTTPCYVIAHDAGWRLPDKWPSGRPTNLLRHETIADCRQSIEREPGRIHTVACPDAAEVVALGEEIAQKSLERYSTDGQQRGIPVLVLIDEIVGYESAGSYRLGDDLRKLISGRRHKNVGIIWTCQMARLCHKSLIALSTSMYLFRVTYREDLKRLEEGSIPREILDQLPTLTQKGAHLKFKVS